MWQSIRWRIALPYIVLLVLTMVGLGLYLSGYLRQSYQDNWRVNLTADARLMADQVRPAFDTSPNAGDLETQAADYARILNVRVTLIRADGAVLGESNADPALMENHWSRPEVQQALSNQEGFAVRSSATLKTVMLYVAAPVSSGGKVLGVVRLAVPLDRLDAEVNHMRQTLYLVGVIALALAILLSVLTTGYSLRPLNEITQAALQMSTGDFKATRLPDGPSEIGQLSQALRQMAVQLDAQFDALKAERTKLSAVLAQMTDGVVIVNAEGRIELVNQAAERIFGIQNSPAGHSLVEVIRHHQLVDLWRKCRDTGEQQTTTLEVSAERIFLQGIAIPLGRRFRAAPCSCSRTSPGCAAWKWCGAISSATSPTSCAPRWPPLKR